MKKKIREIIIGGSTASLLLSASFVGAESSPVNYSLSQGAIVPIAAHKANLPLMVYGQSGRVKSPFTASGYMGDGVKILSVQEGDRNALQITFSGRGRDGWAGVYWLTPANNWGKIKGAGYDLTKAKRLSFWARGDVGGERIAEFKMGGVVGPYPDTAQASTGVVRLSREWKQYFISLDGKDMRHIVGGFAFIIRRADNPAGARFYLDEVRYEAYDPSAAAVSVETKSPDAPAEAAAPAAQPVIPASVPRLPQPVEQTVFFPNGKSDFRETSQNELAAVIEAARIYTGSKILIEGHTDNVGSPDVNRKLSLERAKAVSEYLETAGVDASRITTTGVGSDRPLASNGSVEGRRKNRRVEIRVTQE